MNFKKNYILFLLSFFLLIAGIKAQDKKIDSLKIKLDHHRIKDTTRFNILYDLAYANFRKDLDSTTFYLEKAEKLSDSLNYTKGKARVFFAKGRLENMKANYTKSLTFFKKSLTYFKAIQDTKRIADVYVAFGITNSDLSQYDDAIENFKKATEIYKDLGNKKEIVTCLINTANVYSELGSYKGAIANYKEALILCKAINDEDHISYVSINLGVVYSRQGNYPLAIKSYTESLTYEEKRENKLGIANSLFNLADTYTSIRRYDKALEYHKKSLKLLENTEYKVLINLNYSNIGSIYMYKKDYTKALEYFNRSLKTSQEIGNFRKVATDFINIGNIYLQENKSLIARKNYSKARDISKQINNKRILSFSLLGISETFLQDKQYKKALSNALEGQQLAKELDLLESQKTASDILSEVYQHMGQYKKALESHQEFKKLNDSLFNKENIEKITQIEYDYKYKQALDSASIRELKLTKTVLDTSQNLKKSQRNLLFGIVAFLITTLVLGIVILSLKLRNEKSKTQNVIIEQKLLRSQMTPHFIFNSLSVLQGMILNKEQKKSVSYVSKFSKLLRTILENSRDRTVLFSEELIAIENYLALQNLENQLYTYTISVEDTIDTSLFKIPPMLIQPFVENAVEHAFINVTGDRIINIELTYSNQELICMITDNGVGIDYLMEDKNQDKKSLSTTITAERLQLLSKDFKKKGSVVIEDRKKYNERGTIVTLIIPYIIIQSSENINS
ncbi:tetratricopeptide repeat protein [Tenacibaculum tangerinum]|uniref:Tetratricopeptide repeat protein n=1 Tax=Tenacibaculum tangerinum TaxID=3038772 RepID=A0ABY8L133_9FLAO|nr:tetratricopeptide repeat protein [Tenacibaculum tangerinum]WGH75172.1 tetratricopeptide repeat protein [Tenacibaculum tangerinum]